MKQFLWSMLCFCSVLSMGKSASGQWTKLNSGTTAQLYKIHFLDSQTGFCVGGNDFSMPAGNGIILRTTDSGDNWSTVYKDSTAVFRQVTASASRNVISVFGTNNVGQHILAESFDGGGNWTETIVPYNAVNPSYIDNQLFYINADSQTLEQIAFGTGLELRQRVALYTSDKVSTIYTLSYSNTLGYNFVFARSPDAGGDWDTSLVNFDNITSNSLSGSSLWAFGDTVVFLATYPSAIAYSYDKGDTWTDFLTNAPTWDAFMTSATEITGADPLKKILKSHDAGKTALIQDSTDKRVKNFFFVNSRLGFLCGDSGIIYKTVNGGGTTTIHYFNENANKTILYPNPFHNNITLETEIVLTDGVLQIYNAAGQKIRSVSNLSGQKILIEREGLPAGTYFYVLAQDNLLISTGKITVAGE